MKYRTKRFFKVMTLAALCMAWILGTCGLPAILANKGHYVAATITFFIGMVPIIMSIMYAGGQFERP